MTSQNPSLRIRDDDLKSFLFSKRTLRTGFSLVELVVVMAIMAMILALAAISMRPSALRAAHVSRDLVIAQVNRARSHAIASGIPTAVVFSPYQEGPAEKRGRMMGLVEVKNGTLAGADHEVARVLARWEELPKGQFFLTQALAQRQTTTVLDGERKLHLTVDGEEVEGNYLLFSREGEVIYPTASKIEICLAPAVMQNGRPRLTGENQDGSSVDVIEVSRLSGRVRLINSALR